MLKNPNLIGKWLAALPAATRAAVDTVIALARRRGLPAYLVGGPLRDLLLRRPPLDADIVIEGDAVALAREAAAHVAARLVTHPAFGTATFRAPGLTVDLVTARSEVYPRPGALPVVRPAAIADDLARRDFTVNAMALGLTPPREGDLIDPHGGRRDLKDRLLRVLHDRSFQDDATRILRAARYAVRFRFRIEERTLELLRRDVGYLDTISGARLHNEFSRIANEEAPGEVLRLLDDLGALAAVHPALRFGEEQAQAMREAKERGAPPLTFWALLAFPADAADAASISRRLALTRAQSRAVEAVPEVRSLAPRLSGASASEIARRLDPFPPAAVWAVALASPPAVREPLLRYVTAMRGLRPRLSGRDLIALGVPEGPRVGEILRRLREARLDGAVATRRDEEQLVRDLVQQTDADARHLQ